MNKQRMEILKEMLFELDNIIKSNGMQYTLVGELAKEIYDNGEFPHFFDHISIAMTTGDIEKLARLINTREYPDREIEYILNNPAARFTDIRYYNLNTTFIHINEFGIQRNYGYYIKIFPIYNAKKKRGKKGILLKFLENRLNQGNKRVGTCTVSEVIPVILSKLFCAIVGKNRLGNTIYRLFNEVRGINCWDDIANYRIVRLATAKYTRKQLADKTEPMKNFDVRVAGRNVSIADEAVDKKTERRNLYAKVGQNILESADIPYSDYITAEKSEMLKRIQKQHDKALRIRKASLEARHYIKKSWGIYFMTRDVVSLRKVYTEPHIEELAQMLDNNSIEAFTEAVKTYTDTADKWKKKKTPFIAINKLEELIVRAEEK